MNVLRNGGRHALRWSAVGILLLSLLGVGALGFRDPADCKPPLAGTDLAICLHEAAISKASLAGQNIPSNPNGPSCSPVPGASLNTQSCNDAVQACQKIQNINPLPSNWQGQQNLCFSDIAFYMRDPGTCNLIPPTSGSVLLTGAEVTRISCLDKINSAYQAQNFKCALLFFPFALLLGGVIFLLKCP